MTVAATQLVEREAEKPVIATAITGFPRPCLEAFGC
jgi:hypothetical protein